MFNRNKKMNMIKTAVCAAAIGAYLTMSAFAADTAKKGEKLKPYTPTTCLVTDEKLGSMGKPYVHEYKGQEVKFCCKGCLKDFNKDPDKFMKKLEDAQKGKKTKGAVNSHKGHKH
jgi:YHS domain-containing protein